VSLRKLLPLAVAFATLALLVSFGALTRFDQWGVDHLMPGASFGEKEPTFTDSLVPLLGAHWDTWLGGAANIVTLPASFLLSLAIVAWRSRLLAVALIAGVAVEVVCKELIDRPALYDGAFHITSFDSSFPSGHTLRTILVAAAVWPLLRGWAVAWAVASIVLLQLAAWHTPTDVLGGVLLGLLALLGARGAGALRARRLARG
jgi:membrane-associated phospholipid phosphatase